MNVEDEAHRVVQQKIVFTRMAYSRQVFEASMVCPYGEQGLKGEGMGEKDVKGSHGGAGRWPVP